uniref:Conotoxin n=1 Tax=Conus praecellens TaxID=128530 RepID=A0A291C2I3_CONPC|nr:conotoxin [Conus praecellens]
MKLTCVLIVAVLFLTACQLLTADDSRDKPGYPALRSIIKTWSSRQSRSVRTCTDPYYDCDSSEECCSKGCMFEMTTGQYCV